MLNGGFCLNRQCQVFRKIDHGPLLLCLVYYNISLSLSFREGEKSRGTWIFIMKMASSANTEACYVALLGLAENFRTSNPPNIKLCIHCLQSILTLQLAPKIETRTRVQLGNILIAHTKNTDLAISNLEKAVNKIYLKLNKRTITYIHFSIYLNY